MSCTPAPNTQYPLGTTQVSCVAADPLGHRSAPGTFSVTVVDTLGPEFPALAPVILEATGRTQHALSLGDLAALRNLT